MHKITKTFARVVLDIEVEIPSTIGDAIKAGDQGALEGARAALVRLAADEIRGSLPAVILRDEALPEDDEAEPAPGRIGDQLVTMGRAR